MFKTIVKYLQENPGPGFNKITEITEHIYMSDFENTNDIEMLKSFGIKCILDVSNIERPPEQVKLFDKKRIDLININVPKNISNIPLETFAKIINTGYEIIHNCVSQNKKILVHCSNGVDVSSAFVIFYFLKRYYFTNYLKNKEKTKQIISDDEYFLLDIIKFVKNRRLCIEPNPDLIIMLLKIEEGIKDFYIQSLRIEADEYKIEILKQKLQTQNRDEFDPYGDMDEPINLIEYLELKQFN